ncbi:MAG: carboxymuconolactone decarboxylase family protein [Hyphomicrobiaceae bacterium]|nr:carboxymuconolactone decarboxylase family protein [Hyphomicrobiaceae bacterium]
MTTSQKDDIGTRRFPELTREAMTPAQAQMADAVLGGPRGRLVGPFNAWLRSPDLGNRLQKVGEYIRFSSSLPARLNELAILIVARSWTSQFEWWAHHRFALEAGLDPQVAADIAAGRRPTTMQADEAILYDFATELRRDRRVGEATYEAMRRQFGEQAIVDVIAAMGYYDIVSMTLNVAEVAVPAGEREPLQPLDRAYP